jgi:hypothetical protein
MTAKKETTSIPDQVPELFKEKIGYIQSTLSVPKDQYNSFTKFYFRNLDSITTALKPILRAVNCRLMFNDEVVLIGDRYYVKSTASIKCNNSSDLESSIAYAREPLAKKGFDEGQISGATSTYARKLAVQGLLCIDDGIDSDDFDNTESGNTTAQPTISKQINDAMNNIQTLNNSGDYDGATNAFNNLSHLDKQQVWSVLLPEWKEALAYLKYQG